MLEEGGVVSYFQKDLEVLDQTFHATCLPTFCFCLDSWVFILPMASNWVARRGNGKIPTIALCTIPPAGLTAVVPLVLPFLTGSWVPSVRSPRLRNKTTQNCHGL